MRRNPRLLKAIALFIIFQLSLQIFFPTISYALTSGPSQPEFSSFEPVTATNMVDEFTGDFSYNIPLLEVPGPHGGSYPVSLSYHSGGSPEEEASWVGYGWTLNAGAINRSVRGIPDDFKGQIITNHNRTPKNWTATVGAGAFLEFLSADGGMIEPSLNASIRYNNYRGFSVIKNAGISLGGGLVSMGFAMGESSGEKSFSLNISPMAILNKPVKDGKDQADVEVDREYKAKDAFKSYFRTRASNTLSRLTSFDLGSKYGIFTYNHGGSIPLFTSTYEGASYNVSATFNLDPSPFEIGSGFNVMGSYTYQQNKSSTDVGAYGYLYSFFATKSHMMDYHLEKDNPYDKQDEFIGIPFTDADQFAVSGEGIGGGFRLYASRVGQFGPTEAVSTMDIRQIGSEFEAGANWGGGIDIGIGQNKFTISDWKRNVPNSFFPDPTSSTSNEAFFFRFNNDLGGAWGERSKYNDLPKRVSIDAAGTPVTSEDFSINSGVRAGRSSFIGYHTNQQLSTNPLIAYSKRSWASFIDRSINSNLVGELSVLNENGFRYVYALPVYSKNEKNLSVGLPDKFNSGEIEKNFVAYKKRESVMKVGQEKLSPYAHSYLITEILSPEYLDKTGDGVTSDDIGGYVRFGYHKVYGDVTSEKSNWYHWRIPYNGVGYQRNSLSDKKDDAGTLVSGDKEIYYLRTIETKTHVAIFYTSDRIDGLGAADDETAMTKGQKNSNAVQKRLDKIELYSINSLGATDLHDAEGNIDVQTLTAVKPIKTVHFKYASSGELMPNAPNTSAGGRGRLTLEKVYFEYNGVVQAKLSPYRFEYRYPTSYPSPYTGLVMPSINWTFGDPQNPAYDPLNVDAWGNFQPFGGNQYEKMRTWIDQALIPNVYNNQTPDISFDPAPWHLKKIVLPSGGEIHIQYEQDDYQYVQDQDAHVMIPLSTNPVNNKFYLNLAAMGITGTDPNSMAQRAVLKSLIQNRYIDTNKKMYFKFLYRLKGPAGSEEPTLNSCNAEFITGYARVTSVNYDSQNGDFYVEFGDARMPKDVCEDFAYTNVIGRVNSTSDCDRTNDMVEINQTGTDKAKEALAAVKGLFSAFFESSFSNSVGDYCKVMNPADSYLRVPTVNPKRGGGVRVKRLLMYDNTLGSTAELYGNEYTYSTFENGRTISSGVATNEPNREENILVEYLEKKTQSWANVIVAGKDKEVSEGPLGESVYPGPSVGYSKITINNIHKGKTNPGFSVTEFYTARDYPVRFDKTGIAGTAKLQFKFKVFSTKFVNKQTASQGFSVILNNMHGQMRKKCSYSGDYSAGVDMSKSTLVSEQAFEYFEPTEVIPVMNDVYGSITYASLGREMDYTFAQRSISESNINGNTEVDLTAGMLGAFVVPMFNLMGTINKTEALLNTHVTSKLIRYPAIVKKVTTYQDGIYHTDEYVAFDAMNGKPVAVKSKDEYKGAYLNQSIPAGWKYDNFRQSTEDFLLDLSGQSIQIGRVNAVQEKYKIALGSNYCSQVTNFAIGDLVKVDTYGDYKRDYFHIEDIDYSSNTLNLVVSSMDAGQSQTFSEDVRTIKVLRSGRNNQLNQSAGTILFHDPVKDNIDPSDLTDASRYTTSTFTTALEAGFEGASTTFTVAGPFADMNMEQYSTYSPGCVTDWRKATIRNINFQKIVVGNSVTLKMNSFEILCASTWVPIQRL